MNPDWYTGWREEAFDQLKAKNDRLQKDFRLGSWPRYDYDLKARKLLFSEQGVIKVVAEIQIAGSTSAKADNWLWAWANSNLPGELLEDAKRVRSFGEEKGIDELAQAYVLDTNNDLEALGWGLSGAMVRICDALGAYRSPRGEGGGLYLIFKTIGWAS
ncbi:MAG: hypothetical protein EOS54_09725 [Mesorhizobium sp.]|uniref:DUF6882 domain-containing protein n=1 Tax=unclassified Mesorhizobium TaxID=325217 RepID=UPI000F75949B|nr:MULTISPECIES: DUF6882 domain-containing protein [unclassified Mesorhizobium]AZO47247.1 hypothetical protein EJ073_04950 [Mesorhizobium sp. M4B.F.Ca.ET.058.02.1.1]RUX50242.1 hypothetical protein EOA33_10080 [Mesorhizobium sp. M4A.F.Ca.ET.050.02.1.1]RVC44613.1 hypothetical protein EN781_13275 [Mesorhizobium sp. M4A.F.Ca.ET.090.04.2.1]RVC78054.1 hypothetical protein EN745_20045 [Mesorhizobium sp. M4A.F.Ca.ET.022.05.2.1]RVD32231.1 hypothetical protein EN742_32840 [Mesorhizobium sp. M4A.F.Ca.ET.